MQMTVQEYFGLPDTPMAESPIGRTMTRLLDKRPGLSFEQARTTAAELLKVSAARKNYRTPEVLSVAEAEAGRARMLTAFRNRSTTLVGVDSRTGVDTQTALDYSQ